VRVGLFAFTIIVLLGGPGPARETDEPTTLVYPPFGHCLGLHKVTDFHRFLYLGMRTRLDDPTGIAAVKLVANDDPTTESDDDELTVFGLNTGRCEIIYNRSLYEADIYGKCGRGPGEFRHPLGIAADPSGNVYVADTGNDRVVHLRLTDGRLEFVAAYGESGSGRGEFDHPSQIAVGLSGALYVSDTGNDRIVVVNPDGSVQRVITGDRASGVNLDGPVGLAAVEGEDPWINRRRDFIVVADRGGTRLVKLSREGTVEAAVQAESLPVEGARFAYLAIDFYGSVYATDPGNCQIHKFDSNLRYVTSFGRCGDGPREFDEPRGITLWKRFGQIFLTERTGAQYLWIGTDIQNLSVEPAELVPGSGELRLTYFLTEAARVSVEVLDENGDVVRTLVGRRRRAMGENVERWDGTLARGKGPLPPGHYTLRVTAAATYSSGKYFHDTAETEVTLLPEVPY